MTFHVGQFREKAGKDQYVEVATCHEPEDAVLVAAALFRAKPPLGDSIQVWRMNKGRHGYCLVSLSPGDPHGENALAKAVASCRAQEKEWHAKERKDKAAQKAASAARAAFHRRFNLFAGYGGASPALEVLADEQFRRAFWATPPRIEEAEARAIEMGLQPQEEGKQS